MAALNQAKRLVVKVGSALLVENGTLRAEWLAGLAEDVAQIKTRGTDVILVSSGSIALGRGVLDQAAGPLPLEQSQAAAAVGQIRLARAYEQALAPHDIVTGQVLVTLDDSTDRRRYLNSRATLEHLIAHGVVPIVNENDTIATDEIRFGDNDRLAAQIAVTVGADQLVLLSDVDGLYTGDPKTNSNAKHIPIVEKITDAVDAMAGDAGSGLSKGGMKTKILAARTATSGGCAMAITLGAVNRPLTALENGAAATWFLPETDPHQARKRWIGAMKPKGDIHVDEGAIGALKRGKSLLPAGVTLVKGTFGRGDPVAIRSADGSQIGVGLTRYTSEEATLILGRRSGEIESMLGYPGRAALIHRDDMVL